MGSPATTVDEAAYVDDGEAGTVVGLRRLVALGLQVGADQFGIGECLRAGEAEGDAWRRSRLGVEPRPA